MVATPQAALAMRDDDPAVVHDVAITRHAGLALQLGGPQQRVPLADISRDILNGDGEGLQYNIPQGKVATPGDAGLALQHGRPQQRVPLLALPPSISIGPEQSASNVANTMARDILNPDGEGRKDDIPQGKVGVDDLAQHILDNKAKHKKK